MLNTEILNGVMGLRSIIMGSSSLSVIWEYLWLYSTSQSLDRKLIFRSSENSWVSL